ncbi:TPA: hypothetical protein EYP13_02070 [Candidatus Micrarchaeota archaeon]|nr:hypothetical protein [Candidatus Micrarchaeota archaeon]
MARKLKKKPVKVPQSVLDFFNNHAKDIIQGAKLLAERYPDAVPDVKMEFPLETSAAKALAVAASVILEDEGLLEVVSRFAEELYPKFKREIAELRRDTHVINMYAPAKTTQLAKRILDATGLGKDPLFGSKFALYSFVIYVLSYYLVAVSTGRAVADTAARQENNGSKYWALIDYELEYSDHLVVSVGNITPNDEPEELSSLTDPYGTYHDIVFASALLAGIHAGLFTLPDAITSAIKDLLPVAAPPEDVSFEDAFYAYQHNIVKAYKKLSRRVTTASDVFGHLVTVLYKVDPSIDRDQFGQQRTFADVRIRPGTYWVHANFITVLPDDRMDDVHGTTQRNDVAIFTDRSFVPAPSLRVSKYRLFRLLADPRANRKEYMILVRSKTVARKPQPSGEREESGHGTAIPSATPVRMEYDLLSLIPISPEVVVRRDAGLKTAHIVDVRDTFSLESPSSYRDILDSLYLLARAYAPSYAVLYDGGVVGKDQYLALLAAMLSYLSPTLAVTNFDRKYDPRIHTLLYGIKGVGKTYLFEQYHYHWQHNILYLFAGVRITEAKLLGGAMHVDTGKSRATRLVFRPGEIIKADGGMIAIDELDRLARDSDKRAIADAIANVMASGYAPARHVLSDTPTIDIRVHGSVVAAANPIGLKSGNYVEEMFAAMFILNDEIREHYKKLAPEVVEEIEAKFFEKASAGLDNPSGRKLIADLEYLASDTPYTFIHYDFYNDPTLHKYIDRVTFAIPMYTMVGAPPQEFIKSGRTSAGKIVIYDSKVADGRLEIPQQALLDFTQHLQTVSPFTQESDDTALYNLLKESVSVSDAWRRTVAKTYARKIRATVDSRETMRVFLRSLGARESKVAFRLAHTILKIFDESELNSKYTRAILELISIRDSLLYSNPGGHIKTPLPLPEALRMALRDILYLGETVTGSNRVYYIKPEHIEAVYADILSKYVIRIPEKGGAPFDAVEHFQSVIQKTIALLQGAGVLVQRQDEEGEVFPALVGDTPDDLVRKIAFKVNRQGYLHVFYEGNDLGSVGRVVK